MVLVTTNIHGIPTARTTQPGQQHTDDRRRISRRRDEHRHRRRSAAAANVITMVRRPPIVNINHQTRLGTGRTTTIQHTTSSRQATAAIPMLRPHISTTAAVVVLRLAALRINRHHSIHRRLNIIPSRWEFHSVARLYYYFLGILLLNT